MAIKKVGGVFVNPLDARRTLREMQILEFLGGRGGVVGLLDAFPPPQSPLTFGDVYLVQELCDSDLHQIIRSPQPLGVEHVRFFTYQVLRALRYVHSAGIVHRDLKPSNLLVDANCELKLCDFGLARADRAPRAAGGRGAGGVGGGAGIGAGRRQSGMARGESLGSLRDAEALGESEANGAWRVCPQQAERDARGAGDGLPLRPLDAALGGARGSGHASASASSGAASNAPGGTTAARTAAASATAPAAACAPASSGPRGTVGGGATSGPPGLAAATGGAPSDPLDHPPPEYVVTRWYRSPELLLSCANQGPPIDVWSAGCVLAELLGRKPLFPGRDFAHQLSLICRVLGTPSKRFTDSLESPRARAYLASMPDIQPVDLGQLFPRAPPDAVDLLARLLAFDPRQRPSAEEALRHPFLRPLADPSDEPVAAETFYADPAEGGSGAHVRSALYALMRRFNPQLGAEEDARKAKEETDKKQTTK